MSRLRTALRGRTRGRADDDRGVALLFVALLMVAMLIMVAIVIDLGRERANQRADSSTADLAALAAGYYLSGHASSTAKPDPLGACQAAYNSAHTNQPSFSPAGGSAPCSDPATGFPTADANTCTVSTSPIQVSMTGGGYTLTVRWPIPSSELTDPRVSGAEGNDGTDADRCQRIRVTFTLTDSTYFAGVIGQGTLTTSGTAVVRAKTDKVGQGVAALLMLERVGCGSLQTSGGGGSGEGVVVQAPDATHPGVIQADTAGIVGSSAGPPLLTCGNGASGQPANYSLFGTALPSGSPSITAQTSGDGSTPGIIGIYSLAVAGRPGYQYPGGLSVNPVAGPVSSRQPADDKYNSLTNHQITTLHNTAYARANGSALAGDTILSGNQECGGTIAAAKLTATSYFVDCPTFQPAVNIFPNATTFVVKGNIQIKSGSVLDLPAARTIDIRGCAVGGCSGSNIFAIDIANGGSLFVNTGETSSPGSVPCSSRRSPTYTPAGSTTNWTAIATFSGPFNVAGLARLCQTFVYLGKDAPTYTRQSVTSTLTGTENYPVVTKCSATLPCPMNSGYNASVQVTGGSGVTDWTAPNQLATQPTDSDFATYPFEDLALWGETNSTSNLKGQGGNNTEGVYFLPNGSAIFTGQGAQPIGENAQYFMRNLNVSGQGTLKLKPNPADAIVTPIPGQFALIR